MGGGGWGGGEVGLELPAQTTNLNQTISSGAQAEALAGVSCKRS